MERSDGDGSVPGIERLTLIGLVLAAVGLRLIGIGHLSFAGDEETTTLAAKALLEGWPPPLPTSTLAICTCWILECRECSSMK